MKRLLLVGLLAGMGAVVADHHKAGEWTSLFDGKTLEGWKSSPDNPAAFSVVDGTLKVNGKRAHLYYVGKGGKASFKNFELKAKVKTLANSNSGIYIHTAFQDKGWPAKGYEVQVNTTHRDPKKTGSLYAVENIFVDGKAIPEGGISKDKGGTNHHRKEPPSKDGEWFDYHVTVKGKTITIKVNGETTVKFTEPEGWKGPSPNTPGRVLGEGQIALQAHDPGSTVFYKDIQIKELK